MMNWIKIWLCISGILLVLWLLTAHAQKPSDGDSHVMESHKAEATKPEPKQTFIFTSPYDITAGQPIRVRGKDRLEALARMGFTVWTEREWKDCKPCQDSDKKLSK